MTIKPLHRLVVSRLMRLAPRFEALGCHLQLQSPITIEPSHEPEPDGLVVHGGIEDYVDRHPGPADVSCLIEVSESSLERDRTTKKRIYATAGIAQYVILNLADQRAEVYEEPQPGAGRYGSERILSQDEVIALRTPGGEAVAVPAARLIG